MEENIEQKNNNESPEKNGEKTAVVRDEKGRIVSGVLNPKGKSVGTKSFETDFDEAVDELAKENGMSRSEARKLLLKVAFKQAKDGNYSFFKDIHDRIYGQAKATVEHSGDLVISGAREMASKLQDILKDEDNGETKESDKVANPDVLQGEGQESLPDNG